MQRGKSSFSLFVVWKDIVGTYKSFQLSFWFSGIWIILNYSILWFSLGIELSHALQNSSFMQMVLIILLYPISLVSGLLLFRGCTLIFSFERRKREGERAYQSIIWAVLLLFPCCGMFFF